MTVEERNCVIIESTIYKETCINSRVIEACKDVTENLAGEAIQVHCRVEDVQAGQLNFRVDGFPLAPGAGPF